MKTITKFINTETIHWQGLKEGDPKAFRRIYDQYWDSLYGTAFSFTYEHDQSCDLVQDVFVDLWVNRDKIDLNRSPKAYMKSILRNKVISYLRHLSAGRKEAFLSKVKNELYQGGVNDSTSESIVYNDLASWIDVFLGQLPEKSRRIFELSRFENYTNQEIASNLDISVKTVEYHISKVLNILRPQLLQLTDTALLTAFAYFIIGEG